MFALARRLVLLSGLCSAVGGLMADHAAHAAPRRTVFIVEPPLSASESPPDALQVQRAIELRNHLYERLLQLEIDGYVAADGRLAIENNDPKIFEEAEVVIQVMITVSAPGYLVETYLRDKKDARWLTLVNKPFGEPTATTLDALVAKEVVPPIVVREFELARPSDRAVLLADCLLPPPAAGDARIDSAGTAGRILSSQYVNALKQSAGLERRYVIARLVPTSLPKFYKWWCIELDPPRRGFGEDTTTVFGQIDALPTSHGSGTVAEQLVLQLELKRLDRSVTSDFIDLNLRTPDETRNTVLKIRRAVEALADAM